MRLLARVFIILTLILSPSASIAVEPRDFHAYVAFGNNYNFPGSIRIGYNEWELGLLSMGVFGVVKRNYFQKHYYIEFGPSLIGSGSGVGFGFVAGLGFDYLLVWRLGLRGGILGFADHNGYAGARGNLGVSIDF